jgi:DNA-directed RNA polymerase subunit H (RpoH/RPB5)
MFEDLCFIVVDHVKVPKFTRVAKEDEAALLTKLKCRKSNLSRMQLSRCPIARYYAYDVGDMIRVQGASREAGMYTTYSVVVA